LNIRVCYISGYRVFGGKNLVFPTDLISLREQLSRRLSRITRLSRTRDGRRDTPSTTGAWATASPAMESSNLSPDQILVGLARHG
jgi:hypothetical protein